MSVDTDVLIAGAGACGMVAALTLSDAGIEPVLLERDAAPQGSTALSSGMIPACGTAVQHGAGIGDSVDRLAGDVMRKNGGEAEPDLVQAICAASGPAIDWLAEAHGVRLELVRGFLYPGHCVERMHAHPERTGAALIGALAQAAERAGATLMTRSVLADLEPAGNGWRAAVSRPDGSVEQISCRHFLFSCNGFGGNSEMVSEHIPGMRDALYFGHAGNRGDAVRIGARLGAALRHMGAFQGHGSVAHPHGILITWALITEGGIQVNAGGERFSDESRGYSEQAAVVAAQSGGIAWDVYDARLHRLGLEFPDYRQAVEAGAVRVAPDVASLAAQMNVPADRLAATLESAAACAEGRATDPFGRDFTGKPPLAPPYFAVRVRGALFHTQGGLAVDPSGRVLRPDGSAIPGLWAGGGAACGISGNADWGYLSGNGLLSAVALGRLAAQGIAAAL